MEQMIGINIGAASVKSVLMRKVKERFFLEDCRIIELPPAADKEGKEAALMAALKKSLEGYNVKQARVFCALDSREIHSTVLMLPPMPKKEMDEAVIWEIKNQSSTVPKDFILDYKIPMGVSDSGNKKVKVAVTVAPKALIDDVAGLFAQLGIAPAAILPGSAALEVLFTDQTNKKADEALAILDIGESLSDLFIYRKGILEFTRRLPLTVDDFARSLTSPLITPQGKVQLSLEEARLALREQGIPDGKSTELIQGKLNANNVMSLIRSKLEQLKLEMERSFDYFREMHGQNIERVVLFGGCENLKGLAQYLKTELETPVEHGHLPAQVIIEQKAQADRGTMNGLHVAIGAALSQGEKVNLILREQKDTDSNLIREMSVAFVAALIIMTLSVSLFFLGKERKMLQTRMAKTQLRIGVLIKQVDQVREQTEFIQKVFENPLWDEAFKELSNLITEDIVITEATMKDNVLHLKGEINKKTAQGTEQLISDLMLTLEQKMFKNVNLIESRENVKDPSITQFEISCAIDGV